MTNALQYADWKAPAQDGQTLLWPAPPDLLRQTQENQQVLSNAEQRIQNLPLSEIRRAVRQWVGHADEQPLIATGHQTELHHPGVWVKNILIDAVASKLSGQAYHLAVDTDEPKHLLLRWPPDGAEPITDDPAAASDAWAGLMNSPTPAHLHQVEQKLREAKKQWPFEPMAGEFFRILRRLLLEPQPLPMALTAALHELDWSLGLRHHALVASPLWMSEGFLVFAHHLLAHAGELAQAYNAALSSYRREQNITTPGRPMPDLKLETDHCESPFWLDDLSNASRSRGSVSRMGRRWGLNFRGDRFEFDAALDGWESARRLTAFLRRHNLRLSPRALTLTMFVRLLLADQFVHGIGGGRYDQVADRIIRSFFELEPPRFSVTTATLYFPTAVGRTRACLPCVLQEGHHLKHNLLGARKRELVATIDSLPRRSIQRQQIFTRMHDELARAASASDVMRQWQQRLEETRQQSREDALLFDRELFYALQPRERLDMLIARYRKIIAEL